jgi:hypothetical protein
VLEDLFGRLRMGGIDCMSTLLVHVGIEPMLITLRQYKIPVFVLKAEYERVDLRLT